MVQEIAAIKVAMEVVLPDKVKQNHTVLVEVAVLKMLAELVVRHHKMVLSEKVVLDLMQVVDMEALVVADGMAVEV